MRAAVALFLVGCASAHAPASVSAPNITAAPAAAAPLVCPPPAPRAETAPPQESLLAYVPADSLAVFLLRAHSLGLVRRYFAENPELRDELSQHFARTIGIDFTRIEGAALSIATIAPPSGALLLRMTGDTPPLGLPEVARAGDVALHKLGDWFAARVPGGVVLGSEAGVRKQIALARGKVKPLDASAPLGRALGDSAAVDAALVVDGSGVPDLGVERGAFTLDSAGRFALTLTGDPAKLEQARVLFEGLARKSLVDLEAEKARARGRADVFEGAIAIASFYAAQKLVREIEPKLVGNQLVSEYRMPRIETHAGFVPILGMAAAIAIPAFAKYVRKSKTVEARTNLKRLRDAAIAYRAEHEGKKFAFPPSTNWAPARGCCGQPGDKCAPDPAAWSAAAWRALAFTVDDPHYYQYRFVSKGRGTHATFTVEARGDLDCDGDFSLYRFEDGAAEMVVEHDEE